MTINFDFAAKKPATGTTGAAHSGQNTDRPKAQVWLNIGFTQEVILVQGDKEVPETRFVSLPQGIPLDTMEALATNSSNKEFRAFQSARNDLLDQIMAAAEKLEAGEAKIINVQVELRRVKAEEAPIDSDANPFCKKLDL